MSTLPIADSLRTTVYRAFVAQVQADPEVDRIGIDVRSWGGAPDDGDPPAQFPFLRFYPQGGRCFWQQTGELAIPMTIGWELLTDGLDEDDSMNLAELLEDVFVSGDFRAAMAAVGVSMITPTEASFGVKLRYPKWTPLIAGTLFATGAVELMIAREA